MVKENLFHNVHNYKFHKLCSLVGCLESTGLSFCMYVFFLGLEPIEVSVFISFALAGHVQNKMPSAGILE